MASKTARAMASSMKKYQVVRKLDNFREAVELVSAPVPTPGPNEVLVRNSFVGVNASDINMTAGRYSFGGDMPFTPGFEGVGEVAQLGEGCKAFGTGQPIGYISVGSYAEYTVVPEEAAFHIPEVKAEYIPLMATGLTASLALDKCGKLKKDDIVLVTAAAGGTGHIATQWAKLKGCHVIGTCSSDSKTAFLKRIGCDRVVNISKEDLRNVLTTEYKDGINVAYESVGGEQLVAAAKSMAVRGRLLAIGGISTYRNEVFGAETHPLADMPVMFAMLSASMRGFFLFHYATYFHEYVAKHVALYQQGELHPQADMGRHAERPFKGLETIPDAVDYIYSRKSQGKVVVEV